MPAELEGLARPQEVLVEEEKEEKKDEESERQNGGVDLVAFCFVKRKKSVCVLLVIFCLSSPKQLK